MDKARSTIPVLSDIDAQRFPETGAVPMVGIKRCVTLSSDTKRNFDPRFRRWREAGVSVRGAAVLALAGCDSVQDINVLGRSHFEGRPNCAAKTLAELAVLAGWPPKAGTAVDAIAAALQMAVRDPDEAREAATDALIALRRSGFVVLASRQAGTR